MRTLSCWKRRFNNRESCLPYQSQGKKPLKWTLLGFVVPGDQAKLETDRYVSLSGLVKVSENSRGHLVREAN